MSDDPYVYPGSNVLRNMRDIRDCQELEEFEARLTLCGACSSPPDLIAGEYDLAHLAKLPTPLWAWDRRSS